MSGMISSRLTHTRIFFLKYWYCVQWNREAFQQWYRISSTPYMRCRFMSSLASPVTPPTRAHHCLTSQEILCTEYSGHVSPHKARSRDLSRTQFSIHWLTAAKFRVVIDIRKSMVYGLCLCSCTSKFRSQMIIMWQSI